MTEVQVGAALPNSEIIKSKIAELQALLKVQSPQYEAALQHIHKALVADEEVAWLLTEEEVGVICQGLAKKKNITVAVTAGKNKLTSGKALKDVTVDDI